MRWLGNKRPPFCGCTRNVSGDFKRKETNHKAVYGIFQNQINDDDIELTDENGNTFLTLRQQSQKNKDAQILP
jgi:hypothetical protein